MDIILDNKHPETYVGEYLRKQIAANGKLLRVVSAYFTVYAYEMLRDELENIDKVKFLYGDPGSIGEMDPGAKKKKNFNLTEKGLSPSQVLAQKRLAKDCAEWINKKVDVRTIKQKNFLHGKMYHVSRDDAQDSAIVGSSNFTKRGLGFSNAPNLEINLSVTEADSCEALKKWFDDVWKDKQLVQDAKQDVLDALERMGEDHSPELVYFKTLLEIFRERIDARYKAMDKLDEIHIKDTQVWKTLYQFQRDGVIGILNRLQEYNGCILSDNVGLGKTYTALAVIRYYESQNQRVLVLCPKKLSENWKLYPQQFSRPANPFKKDNFHYLVLHHTDLSRESGESNGIDLSNFDWSVFGLVVIDESHNFRNESYDAYNEEGEIIRHSRYGKLLEEVIKSGGKTKVLMLSATPVNTSLTDLRNQIYFMTGKRNDIFKEKLEIGNLDGMLGVAQRKFKDWEQEGTKDKHNLLDNLGGDFFTLLDAISIARSRRHVKNFYPEVVKEIGGFPDRLTPEIKTPQTDIKSELSYDSLYEEMEKFQLSIYTLTKYVVAKEAKQRMEDEKEKYRFNQEHRERFLIGMIRTNFLKRLESSPHSLALTLERTIKKINDAIEGIEKFQELPEDNFEAEKEDEEFIVNKARSPFRLHELDVNGWVVDLHKDKKLLEKVYKKIAAITPDRDGKLKDLKAQIKNKLKNPTVDKDSRRNRKILIFTAFKDTAEYLYRCVVPLAEEYRVECAMVAGDTTHRSGSGETKFDAILTDFAPIGRGRFNRDKNRRPIPDKNPEISILIATDCVSEGQNLQDCDLVINYDIHWNPVRLIQRFGRIDRIGSRNKNIKMVNYWPTEEFDRYLNLKNRVEARMVLVDAAATGDQTLGEEEVRESAEMEINFRDEQLRRLRDGVFDFDDNSDDISMTDFSIDDFLAQLMQYLEANRKQLEETPLGVYAVADCVKKQKDLFSTTADPGVIFCLRHKTPPKKTRARSSLKAYYLVYVRDDGEVRYNYTHAKQVLEIFGGLARGRDTPFQQLCKIFDRETDHGKKMEKYNALLMSAVTTICRHFQHKEASSLSRRDGIVSKRSEQPRDMDDFELVTWLVIKSSN